MVFQEDYRDTVHRKKDPSIVLMPLTEEKESYRGITANTNEIHLLDSKYRLQLPTKSIHECPTQINLEVVSRPSLPYNFVMTALSLSEQTTLSEQATWIIPAIGKERGVPEAKAKDAKGEGPSSIIRKLVKDSGIYALASLVSPLISLALAPFLTHTLSNTEYGSLAVLNTFVTLMAGITQFGLSAAFFRTYRYDYETEHHRLNVLSTLVVLLFLISLPITIVGLVAAPSLAVFLLNVPSLSSAIRVSILVVLVQNLAVPGLSWLRAETRAVLFSTISIINLLVSAGGTIFFVGTMHMGIDGALYATGGGYAVIVCSTLPMILLRAGFHLHFEIAKRMLLFGIPHVLNLLFGWVLQLLDRYLLGVLGSLSQTASYSVAYSLGGSLLNLIVVPFSMAWWVIMYSIAKRDDAERIFQLIFRWFSLVLFFAAFSVSTFGVIILDIFFPPSYHSTALVIPVIALSMVFNGVNVILPLGASLKRKTWLLTIPITSAALINTILNFVLIPYYGAMGAALATLIAYAALSFISHVINQRIYPVSFEISRFLIALVLSVVIYIGGEYLVEVQKTQQLSITLGFRIGSLILCLGCLLVLGMLPNRSRKSI